jgi:hypothetical protein
MNPLGRYWGGILLNSIEKLYTQYFSIARVFYGKNDGISQKLNMPRKPQTAAQSDVLSAYGLTTTCRLGVNIKALFT